MNCHGTDKHENGFSMATYESTMKGGDTGADIVPGKADGSELYRRITLPHDDDDFMPAEGKAPLTADQVKILRWWIDAGAPHHTTVGAIGGDAEIVRAIATELGIGAPGVLAAGQTSESPASADPAMVARLYTAGFLVRQVSQTDAHLVVSVYSPGSQVGPEQIAVLAAAGQNIVELNLQDASVEDSMAAELAKLPAVTRLRLSGNRLTDRGIAALVALPRLERLNVYGNAGITDASVDTLANAKSLRRVDVWQTGITDAGVARLRQRRPDVEVQGASVGALKTGVPERGGGVR
jgi:hypothetical protein